VAKDKKNKKAKADKAIKVPKEVGGVKLPKELRKIGKQAVKAAKNPVVSEMAAGALLAAAAALRSGKDPKAAPGAVAGGAQAAAGGAGQQAVRLSDSLKALAIDLARKTLDGIEEQRKAGAAQAESPAPGGGDAGPGRG
jgi:hypothetical protein